MSTNGVGRRRWSLAWIGVATGFLALPGGVSADCDVVAKAFITKTVISQNSSLKESFDQFIYEADFSTHDDAIKAGISVGVPVYGVPLQVGSTFDRTTKDAWRHDYEGKTHSTRSLDENFHLLSESVSRAALNAWLECVAIQKEGDAGGLSARISEVTPELLILEVGWSPAQGQNGTPKLTADLVVSGATVIAPASSPLVKNAKLKRGYASNRVMLTRDRKDAVGVTLTTTMGTASAALRPHPESPQIKTFTADPASIDADNTTRLTWDVANAKGATLDGVNVAVAGSQSVTPATDHAYVLAVTGDGGSDQRTVRVTVKPAVTVSNLKIEFRTADDDKDDNTGLDVRIANVTSYTQTANERFPDPGVKTKDMTPSSVPLVQLRGCQLWITISPAGHDTWKFDFTLSGDRSDGGKFSYSNPLRVILSDGNPKALFALP